MLLLLGRGSLFLVAVRRPLAWLIVSLLELSGPVGLAAHLFVRLYCIDFILFVSRKVLPQQVELLGFWLLSAPYS